MPRGRNKLRWQLVVNSYPCPECGSGPGFGCRTYSNHPKPEPHAERGRLAHERGWAAADEPARCVRCNGPLEGQDPAPGRCRRCLHADNANRRGHWHATPDNPGPDGSYDVPIWEDQ